ncbi:alpha-1-acid glycoprotein 1 [Erinaceus europaeus]|uniref:Alpha-1-acid glycoprotein 1 n=1 Tax=Erinaceus europaeus TaxID=9365 RepID=A0A1S2ZZ05_ERIEU|nr:alpha-1-acid glycoprotein 1 [Erinaceus europaeus]
MVLPWALTILSLLPLLEAQSPVCGNLTGISITNATLDQLTGKWFYIASAFRHPVFNQSARTIQTAFFYFAPNHTEDLIHLREYLTIDGKCVYNTSYLNVQRKNRTLSKTEFGKEEFAHMVPTKDPKIYMFTFYPNDKQKMGLSLYADKPDLSQEEMQEFYEAIACMGMDKSDIIITEEKKDMCRQLDKQHQEERKKEDGS